MARQVAAHLKTRYISKKHGGYDIYEDDRIVVSLDTYVPNVSVQVITPQGERIPVLQASYSSWSNPQVFKEGRWLGYLKKLHRKAREAERVKIQERDRKEAEESERRYGPVDDAAIFEGIVK